MAEFGRKYNDVALTALRIVAGLLFVMHGAQKLFGWFGAPSPVADVWPLGVAGAIELVGGLMIAAGVFIRYAAFIVCGEMAVAYLWGHVLPNGSLWPWQNRGELPLLFCFIFLVVWASGGGSWTVQSLLQKRQVKAALKTLKLRKAA